MTSPHDVPAFPTAARGHSKEGGSIVDSHSGMSLTEAAALSVLPVVVGLIGIPEDEPDDLWNESIVKQSYAIADAFVSERAKRRGKKS